MTTTVTLHIANPEAEGRSWQIELADDFDTVFGKVSPVTPPASALEHRSNTLHTLADGRRISINPQAIAVIEEGSP